MSQILSLFLFFSLSFSSNGVNIWRRCCCRNKKHVPLSDNPSLCQPGYPLSTPPEIECALRTLSKGKRESHPFGVTAASSTNSMKSNQNATRSEVAEDRLSGLQSPKLRSYSQLTAPYNSSRSARTDDFLQQFEPANSENFHSSKILSWNYSQSSSNTDAIATSNDNSESDKTSSSKNSHSLKFRRIRRKNETVFTVQNVKYLVDQQLETEPGREYKLFVGHPYYQNDTRVTIKVITAKRWDHESKRGDAYSEYTFSRVLAQQFQRSGAVNPNVVNIKGAKWKKSKNGMNVDYVIVMECSCGSLRSIMNAQRASTDSMAEVDAMNVVINMLRQSVFGLKQLQSIKANFRYNNWSPDNLLVDAVSLPISNGIVYKLSDFSKSRAGKHKFGTAPYMSANAGVEVSDVNSMAVMGLEALSVFGCQDNYLWEAIWETCPLKVRESEVPSIRDAQIKIIIQEKEKLFATDAVNDFFKKLAHFAISDNATIAEFEEFWGL